MGYTKLNKIIKNKYIYIYKQVSKRASEQVSKRASEQVSEASKPSVRNVVL